MLPALPRVGLPWMTLAGGSVGAALLAHLTLIPSVTSFRGGGVPDTGGSRNVVRALASVAGRPAGSTGCSLARHCRVEEGAPMKNGPHQNVIYVSVAEAPSAIMTDQTRLVE